MNKHTRQSPAALVAAFRAYRASLRTLGTVALSVSAVKTADTRDRMDTDRRVASLTSAPAQVDENGPEGFALSAPEDAAHAMPSGPYLLTATERAALQAARPGSRALVLRAVPVSVTEDDQPLPADSTVPIFTPYVSTLASLSPEEDSAARAEGEAEASAILAEIEADARNARAYRIAVSFVSDLTPQGSDFAPDGSHGRAYVKPARVTLPRVHNRPASAASVAVRPIGQAKVKPLAGFAALAASLLASSTVNV